MNEPYFTITGNLTSEPQLRYSPQGVAVASFNVASTPRSKNRDSGEYEDGTTLFVRVTAFRKMAENVVETLEKGSRVVVCGRLTREEWQDKEGNKRESLKILADDIGASVKFATAKITKASRSSEQKSAPPEQDPWAISDEEPPF